MSNRPAEHSDGDRSTRNAAHGPENMRFRAIRGALEPKPPLTRRFRTPERRQRLRRHATYVRRLRRRPDRRQRPQPRRGARPRERHFGARRTFAQNHRERRHLRDERPQGYHRVHSQPSDLPRRPTRATHNPSIASRPTAVVAQIISSTAYYAPLSGAAAPHGPLRPVPRRLEHLLPPGAHTRASSTSASIVPVSVRRSAFPVSAARGQA